MKTFLENIVGPAYAHLFARPVFYPLNKALFHLSLRGMGLFNCTPGTSGESHFTNRALPNLLGTESPVLFDVGANVGNYVSLLRQAFPKATIHAFEPHPKNFELLSRKTDQDAQFHQLALGAECGEITLFDRADHDGSSHASVYREAITDWHRQKATQHQITMQTLDSFAKQENIKRIDFLKIDTEGHEFDVLKGAEELLHAKRISVIQFEFGCLDCFSHHFLNDFVKLLPNHTLYRVLPRHLLRLDLSPVEVEIFGHQNIVALPNPH